MRLTKLLQRKNNLITVRGIYLFHNISNIT